MHSEDSEFWTAFLEELTDSDVICSDDFIGYRYRIYYEREGHQFNIANVRFSIIFNTLILSYRGNSCHFDIDSDTWVNDFMEIWRDVVVT